MSAREQVESAHWLVLDKGRQVTGCNCGFVADVEADGGFGDSVVMHLIEVGRNGALDDVEEYADGYGHADQIEVANALTLLVKAERK